MASAVGEGGQGARLAEVDQGVEQGQGPHGRQAAALGRRRLRLRLPGEEHHGQRAADAQPGHVHLGDAADLPDHVDGGAEAPEQVVVEGDVAHRAVVGGLRQLMANVVWPWSTAHSAKLRPGARSMT